MPQGQAALLLHPLGVGVQLHVEEPGRPAQDGVELLLGEGAAGVELPAAHAVHNAQVGHGVDGGSVPGVLVYICKPALPPVGHVQHAGQHGAQLRPGQAALGRKMPLAVPPEQAVGAHGVDGVGVAAVPQVGEPAALIGHPQPLGGLRRGHLLEVPAIGVEHQGLGRQGGQQGGQGVSVRAGVHVVGNRPRHDAQLRVLLAAAQGQGHCRRVLVVHQQGGDHADLVRAVQPPAVEAVDGDLQAVPLKIAVIFGQGGQGLLVQHDLGHALAVGAAAHQHAPPGVPEAARGQLGGGRAAAVGEDDHRLVGGLPVVGGHRLHAPGGGLKVQVVAGAHERAQHIHRRVGVPSAVPPEVHHPHVHPAVVVLHQLGELLSGVLPEAVAVEEAHPALNGQLHVGLHHRAAGEGVPLPLPVPQDGDGHLSTLRPGEAAGVLLIGGHAGLAVDLHDEIPGLEARLPRASAGDGAEDQDALRRVPAGHADADDVGVPLQQLQKRLVLLGGHVLGVGILQEGHQLVQRLGLIGLVRYLVVIQLLQQLQRLVHREGGGGDDQQDQGQRGGQQAGQVFFHGGSPCATHGCCFVN